MDPILSRIYARCKPSDLTNCLEWQGRTDDWGYGVIRIGSTRKKLFKDWRVHRLVWTILNSSIPEGLLIMHACDNPCCVNIDHLSLGTDADNAKDRDAKGRAGDHKGELNGRALLTTEKVYDIRQRYKPKKVTRKMLAEEFGVTKHAIKKIVNRTTWSHV